MSDSKSIDSSMGDSKSVNTSIDKLAVLTWNIWFEDLEYERRMLSIRKTIMELKTDVVCLQEVMPDFEAILRDDNTLNSYYDFSPFDNVRSSYGVISLCRKDWSPDFKFIDFPSSRMNRCLLLTSCYINSSYFAVGNVHLESLSCHAERERQLNICFNHLQEFPSALLVGDFNFCSERNYDLSTHPLQNLSLSTCLPGFVDVWPHLRQEKQSTRSGSASPFSTPTRHDNDNGGADNMMGYTFDSVRNALIDRSASEEERMRYDRVMLRSDSHPGGRGGGQGQRRWVPLDIELVGTSPLDTNLYEHGGRRVQGLFASDHFGVVCQLSATDDDDGAGGGKKEGEEHSCEVHEGYEHAMETDVRAFAETGAVSVGDTAGAHRLGDEHACTASTASTASTPKTGTLCRTCSAPAIADSDRCDECTSYVSWAELDSHAKCVVDALMASSLSGGGARLLAIDFDATIIQVHTYGRWPGSSEALAAHVRPLFASLLRQALDHAHHGTLFVSVVTFSSQISMVRNVLKHVLGSDLVDRVIIRGNDGSWKPLAGSSLEGKQPHIASVIDQVRRNTQDRVCIPMQHVLLIDDDYKNIQIAKKFGANTALFPTIPIHMDCQGGAESIEASGVRVIRRYPLRHGAMLCISQGSVVQFRAGRRGAIVNAANSGGLGGGGVDGAISHAGGKTLLLARKGLPRINSYGDRIPVGEARHSGPDIFGTLEVAYVIHAVGPNYSDVEIPGQGDTLLESAYGNSMQLAELHAIELLAFSLLSAGIFRGDQSLQHVLLIAVREVSAHSYEGLREVHLVGYTEEEIETLLECASGLLREEGSWLRRGANDGAYIRDFMRVLCGAVAADR